MLVAYTKNVIYICVCVYIYTYIYIHIHTYIHTYIHADILCLLACLLACLLTRLHTPWRFRLLKFWYCGLLVFQGLFSAARETKGPWFPVRNGTIRKKLGLQSCPYIGTL